MVSILLELSSLKLPNGPPFIDISANELVFNNGILHINFYQMDCASTLDLIWIYKGLLII